MCLYLPIHLVGLALQFSSEESDWLAETWDEYSVFVGFRQVHRTAVYKVFISGHPGQDIRRQDTHEQDTREGCPIRINLRKAHQHP